MPLVFGVETERRTMQEEVEEVVVMEEGGHKGRGSDKREKV